MRKNILLGICGGIASYKSCELVRLLIKGKFSVKVLMTEAAAKFISPLVFQELSGSPVYLDMFAAAPKISLKEILSLKKFSSTEKMRMCHIKLAQWASLCVIAPLTANTLSKISLGLCDNLLTTVICALPKKTKAVLAPAMNENMWNNPLVQENVKKLSSLAHQKYIILSPRKGELACGDYGEGRMAEPEEIYAKIKWFLRKK